MKAWPFLAVALAALPTPAWSGPEAPPSVQSTEAVAEAPAATVVDHRVEITIATGRMREVQTWTVRVDRPHDYPNGIPAPAGLEGASNQGARVSAGRLVLARSTTPGTVFVLTTPVASQSGTGRAFSGSFLSAQDLPCEHAEFLIQAPAGSDLSVWSDPNGRAGYIRQGRRVARVVWDDIQPDAPAQAVWTTWRSWLQAGEQMALPIEAKLASRAELGPSIASGLSGISVRMVVERVGQRIELDPYGDPSWTAARKATAIFRSGRGTPGDRGVALLSLLRAAGFDARPAWFRPSSTAGEAPTSAPAPSLLPLPAVVVYTERRTVWLDPAAEHAALPDLPGSMVGALAWAAGDVPVQLGKDGISDGQVVINGSLRVNLDGQTQFTGTLTASGVAQEWMRDTLSPLNDTERFAIFEGMARRARSKMDRFGYNDSGIQTTSRPLKITFQGHTVDNLDYFGSGIVLDMPPLIAPSLAAWLPPNITVREEIALITPKTYDVLSAVRPEATYHPRATLARTIRRDGPKVALITEIERPERRSAMSQVNSGVVFLREHASWGPEIVLFGIPAPEVIASIQKEKSSRSKAELAIIEALLWWRATKTKKAESALKTGLERTSMADLLEQIRRHALPGEHRPWLAALELAKTDQDRLAAIRGLEANGMQREAWLHSATLLDSTSAAIRLEALLIMERLQGRAPQAGQDDEGAAVWHAPDELLIQAAAEATQVAGTPEVGDPRVLVRQANHALLRGDAAQSEVLLAKAQQVSRDPMVAVLLAEASALSGVPSGDVVQQIADAVRTAPFNAEVLGVAARAVSHVRRHDLTYEYGLSAARLAFDSPERWGAVIGYALSNGKLAAAVFAAERASDLAPRDVARAEKLRDMAVLTRDRKMVAIANARAGARGFNVSWPPTFDTLMGKVPQNGLLALMRYHDAEVITVPHLLELRAQLEMDAGNRENAARDGALLFQRHQRANGTAIVFGASAGRLWSSVGEQLLDQAAIRDDTARATRMEHRLITAAASPVSDASAMAQDPRAGLILAASRQPNSLAARVPGWPTSLPEPTGPAPRGFVENRVLGAGTGIRAWSDPGRDLAVVRVGRPVGMLPPLLNLLYTPQEPPLQSLPGGGHVIKLIGGPIPVFAAVRIDGDEEVIGLGYTQEASLRALRLALY